MITAPACVGGFHTRFELSEEELLFGGPEDFALGSDDWHSTKADDFGEFSDSGFVAGTGR